MEDFSEACGIFVGFCIIINLVIKLVELILVILIVLAVFAVMAGILYGLYETVITKMEQQMQKYIDQKRLLIEKTEQNFFATLRRNHHG